MASGKLLEYLRSRIEAARHAGEYQKEIMQLVTVISTSVNNTIAIIKKVVAGGRVTGLNSDLAILESWMENLQKLSDALGAAVDSYLETGWNTSEIKRMLAPANVEEVLNKIENGVK